MRIRIKHVVQLLLIAWAVWAFWPNDQSSSNVVPANAGPQSECEIRHPLRAVALHARHDAAERRQASRRVQSVADDFEKLYPDTRIEFVGVPRPARVAGHAAFRRTGAGYHPGQRRRRLAGHPERLVHPAGQVARSAQSVRRDRAQPGSREVVGHLQVPEPPRAARWPRRTGRCTASCST